MLCCFQEGQGRVRVCKSQFLKLHGVSNGRLDRVLQALHCEHPHALQVSLALITPLRLCPVLYMSVYFASFHIDISRICIYTLLGLLHLWKHCLQCKQHFQCSECLLARYYNTLYELVLPGCDQPIISSIDFASTWSGTWNLTNASWHLPRMTLVGASEPPNKAPSVVVLPVCLAISLDVGDVVPIVALRPVVHFFSVTIKVDSLLHSTSPYFLAFHTQYYCFA